MTTTMPHELSELAETLQKLPEEARADVLAEIEAKVQRLRHSLLTDAQRAIVKQRLAEPRVYASADDITALLRRFNPAL
jgi:Mg/Co/Ni transporter MgtE